MRYLAAITALLILLGGMSCTTPDADVVIRLTNPSNKTIAFGGYYNVQSTGDSVGMSGSTPKDYTVTCKGDNDRVWGKVWKDTTEKNMDVLHISLLVNDKEQTSGDVVFPGELLGAQFSVQIKR
ncbi:MAG: hypothetical protein JSU73_01290 [candidate division WOR-3 bacterium]|nr:MAG: hypothetical protein JSU73_01290 [candidate division WOR-3 bacterium]